MKLLFDDIMYAIEDKDQDVIDVRCKNSHQFYAVLEVLLTPSQVSKFIGKETNRTFEVSEKKVNAALEFLKENDKIWE